MINNIQEYAANFSAILASSKLSSYQKKILLGNIIKDIRSTYLKEFKTVKTYKSYEQKKELLGTISCLEKTFKKIHKDNDIE